MKQRNKGLRVIAAIVALFMIGFLLYTLTEFYGNPITKKRAEEQLVSYAKQQYDNLDEFTYEGTKYNMKDGSYSIVYTNIVQPRLSFYISLLANGDIYDDYEFNYVKGVNAWSMYALEWYHALDQKVQDSCDEDFGICIADVYPEQLTKEEHNAFYQNKNIDDLSIMTISGSVRLADLNDPIQIQTQLQKLAALFEGNDTRIKSYTLSISDETGNQGYTLYNVSKEQIQRDEFAQQLTKVLQEPESMKETEGYYIEDLLAK